MSAQKDHYQDLVKLLLPAEIFDYFEITNLLIEERTVSVFLDERDIKPTAYSGQKLNQKVFIPNQSSKTFQSGTRRYSCMFADDAGW